MGSRRWSAQAAAPELYHIHVVQAAPGKLTELIDAYRNGPAPATNTSAGPCPYRSNATRSPCLVVTNSLLVQRGAPDEVALRPGTGGVFRVRLGEPKRVNRS